MEREAALPPSLRPTSQPKHLPTSEDETQVPDLLQRPKVTPTPTTTTTGTSPHISNAHAASAAALLAVPPCRALPHDTVVTPSHTNLTSSSTARKKTPMGLNGRHQHQPQPQPPPMADSSEETEHRHALTTSGADDDADDEADETDGAPEEELARSHKAANKDTPTPATTKTTTTTTSNHTSTAAWADRPPPRRHKSNTSISAHSETLDSSAPATSPSTAAPSRTSSSATLTSKSAAAVSTPTAPAVTNASLDGSHPLPLSRTPTLQPPPQLPQPQQQHALLLQQQRLQQYGCCVFFFPMPILSWLFPLCGHVAISNAEGTVLYTCEGSYFVREESLVDVLGGATALWPQRHRPPTAAAVAAAGRGGHGGSSQGGVRRSLTALWRSLRHQDDADSETAAGEAAGRTAAAGRSGAEHRSRPLLRRSSGSSPTFAREATSATRNGYYSSPVLETPPTSPLLRRSRAEVRQPPPSLEPMPNGGSGSSDPEAQRPSRSYSSGSSPSVLSTKQRRQQYQLASKATNTRGHSNTTCVKVWDLKQLLMTHRWSGHGGARGGSSGSSSSQHPHPHHGCFAATTVPPPPTAAEEQGATAAPSKEGLPRTASNGSEDFITSSLQSSSSSSRSSSPSSSSSSEAEAGQRGRPATTATNSTASATLRDRRRHRTTTPTSGAEEKPRQSSRDTPFFLRPFQQAGYYSCLDGVAGARHHHRRGKRNNFTLLDASTARFYNRQLLSAVQLFRGCPDGVYGFTGRGSLLPEEAAGSSFSFVEYVLEVCGIGAAGQPAAPTSPPTTPLHHNKGGTAAAADSEKQEAALTPEPSTHLVPSTTDMAAANAGGASTVQWGACKLLFAIAVGGRWYHSDAKLGRALHGGSLAATMLAWTVLLYLVYYCVYYPLYHA